MALSNISGESNASQHRDGLFNLLAGLDQAALEGYLGVSAPSDGRDIGSIPGHSVPPSYDLEALRSLVDELWPPRLPGQRVRGRRPVHRLPVVCAILRVCDPEYGVVHNLLAEYRRLKRDDDYRSRSGFSDGLPSRAVFVKTHSRMVQHWQRFRDCQLQSPGHRNGHSPASSGSGHTPGEGNIVQLGQARFHEVLERLDWEGNLPPLLDIDSVASKPAVSAQVNGDVPALFPRKIMGGRRGSPGYWPLYNESQVNEGLDYMALLGGVADLLNLLEADYLTRGGRGRPRCSLGTMTFCLVHKAYYEFSARRLQAQLRMAVQSGHLRSSLPACGDTGSPECRIPRFNTILEYLSSPWMTPILSELVTLSATPVRPIETSFAVDGTGWSTRSYERWLDHRMESESSRQGWVKLHIMSGVATNVVTRAAISPGSHHDNPYFRGLVGETARHFKVLSVMADLAYPAA